MVSGYGAPVSASALSSADIGSPGLAGSWNHDAGANTHTLRAAGYDIWYDSDEFHFVHQEVNGDVELVVRVDSLTYTDYWSKAGLMLRAGTAATDPHASVFVTPGAGVRMQWRESGGGQSSSTGELGGAAPQFLKLVRSGNTFTAHRSDDGSNWSQFHSVVLNFPQTLRAGLALTAHNAGAHATAVFSNFDIT
ncbi:MAG: polysaccharide lyase family 8 super-sandwich domain-containing protein, partial [Opitutaceae bacterium]